MDGELKLQSNESMYIRRVHSDELLGCELVMLDGKIMLYTTVHNDKDSATYSALYELDIEKKAMKELYRFDHIVVSAAVKEYKGNLYIIEGYNDIIKISDGTLEYKNKDENIYRIELKDNGAECEIAAVFKDAIPMDASDYANGGSKYWYTSTDKGILLTGPKVVSEEDSLQADNFICDFSSSSENAKFLPNDKLVSNTATHELKSVYLNGVSR